MKIEDYLYYENISQRQFAKNVGLHWRYVNGLVNGEYIPGRKTALMIEKITQGKVTAVELLLPRSTKSETEPKSVASV
jgi:DNA-binding transcriptional regulator YdaS (Cro superfamily)